MEEHAECMLVLIGATPEGKKELVGFQVGVREGAQSWRELLDRGEAARTRDRARDRGRRRRARLLEGAVAFQYLLETLDEKMGNILSKMEATTNYLNSIQVNDCRLANRMVQIAKGDDNMSGIIEEMTGYKSVKAGFAKSYQNSREKIRRMRTTRPKI